MGCIARIAYVALVLFVAAFGSYLTCAITAASRGHVLFQLHGYGEPIGRFEWVATAVAFAAIFAAGLRLVVKSWRSDK
jgi:hypothetical protein